MSNLNCLCLLKCGEDNNLPLSYKSLGIKTNDVAVRKVANRINRLH